MRSCSRGREGAEEAGNAEAEAAGTRRQRTQRADAGAAALLATPQKLSSFCGYDSCSPSARCPVPRPGPAAPRPFWMRLSASRVAAHAARIARSSTDGPGQVEVAGGLRGLGGAMAVDNVVVCDGTIYCSAAFVEAERCFRRCGSCKLDPLFRPLLFVGILCTRRDVLVLWDREGAPECRAGLATMEDANFVGFRVGRSEVEARAAGGCVGTCSAADGS